MKFSMLPLLLTGESLPGEARQALRENRLKDVATILMGNYGLSCVEAGDLLDFTACNENEKISPKGALIAAKVNLALKDVAEKE